MSRNPTFLNLVLLNGEPEEKLQAAHNAGSGPAPWHRRRRPPRPHARFRPGQNRHYAPPVASLRAARCAALQLIILHRLFRTIKEQRDES
jgi:hypothetical protein